MSKVQTLIKSPKPAMALEPLLDWIDRELVDAYGTQRGLGGNTLLQLRRTLSDAHLNAAVGGFYRLLPRLERHHFLLSYRIRRWIALRFEVLVSDPLGRVEPERIAIRENDRSLIEHRNRFAGHVDVPIEICDLRVQVMGKATAASVEKQGHSCSVA